MYHGVRIQDRALVAAAELSDRYITDRFLPDKAIDLVDQACATIRTDGSNPTELDQVNRRVMQLEIEESALKNESDNASKQRLQELQEELANEKRETSSTSISCRIRKRKNSKFTRKTCAKLDESRQASEDAQTNNNLEKAAELQYGTIPSIGKRT